MRAGSIGGVILIIWLVLGAVAANQRGYFKDDGDASCAQAGTVIVSCSGCEARTRINLTDLGLRWMGGSIWMPGRSRIRPRFQVHSRCKPLPRSSIPRKPTPRRRTRRSRPRR